MLFPWKCIGVSSNLTLLVCSPCSICVLLSIILNESSRARIAGRKMSMAWFWNSKNEVENKVGQNINGLDCSVVCKYSQYELLVIRTLNNLPNGIPRDEYQNAFWVASFSHIFQFFLFFIYIAWICWNIWTTTKQILDMKESRKTLLSQMLLLFSFSHCSCFNDSISDYNGCM